MAYIYRYQINKKDLREKINLTKNNEDVKIIKQVLETLFKDNIKDIEVKDKYFEFKLYNSVENKELRLMGRKLAKKLSFKCGFRRMKQKFYIFVYPYDENGITHIEFLDKSDIDEILEYNIKDLNLKRLEKEEPYPGILNRIENYYMVNYVEKYSIDIIRDIRFQIALYIDVLTTSIYKNEITFNITNKEKIGYFVLEGFHKKVSEEYYLNKLNNYNEIFFDHKNQRNDVLKITKLKEIKNQLKVINKIEQLFDYSIKTVKKIEALNTFKKNDEIKLTVHNVGQGMAISISKNEEDVFYFDFGMSEGKNFDNLPQNITANIEKGKTIILSHIHRDHWFRVKEDKNAYKCKWYIPKQDINRELNNIFAKIIASGGEVNFLENSIDFEGGSIIYENNVTSKHKPGRKASNKHENGICIKLKCKKICNEDEAVIFLNVVIDSEVKNITIKDIETNLEEEKVDILLTGDQRYDYIEDKYLKDIDILVASHHGGSYSWSTRKNVCEELPINLSGENSIIIYSYGKNNTYGHPSTVKQYKDKGWVKEHRTAEDGDYQIDLIIR